MNFPFPCEHGCWCHSVHLLLLSVTSDFPRRWNLTANFLSLWLLNLSIPSFVVIHQPQVQQLFCRCVHRDWAPQLCILIGCSFPSWSPFVAKEVSLTRSEALFCEYNKCLKCKIGTVLVQYIGGFCFSSKFRDHSLVQLAMFPTRGTISSC